MHQTTQCTFWTCNRFSPPTKRHKITPCAAVECNFNLWICEFVKLLFSIRCNLDAQIFEFNHIPLHICLWQSFCGLFRCAKSCAKTLGGTEKRPKLLLLSTKVPPPQMQASIQLMNLILVRSNWQMLQSGRGKSRQPLPPQKSKNLNLFFGGSRKCHNKHMDLFPFWGRAKWKQK